MTEFLSTVNQSAPILLIVAAIFNGVPLLFGTVGEILTEKSGNLNLGVEGMMYMGGAMGLGAAFYYERLAGEATVGVVAVLLALLFAFLAGALCALIFSFLTITLRANQNVTGLALAIFGTGAGQFIGEYMRTTSGGYVAIGNDLKAIFSGSPFPVFLQKLPILGPVLFGHSIFLYLGVLIAVAMALFLGRSRAGLYLRAVGESPATADAAGINVTRYKYLATIIGGGISAIGGMVFIMTIAGCVWNHEGLSGEGWLAVALVIFCLWRPLNAIWGSILFGGLMILYMRLQLPFIPDQIYKILPYVVTVIVLVVVSLRRKRENQPPASLGSGCLREERRLRRNWHSRLESNGRGPPLWGGPLPFHAPGPSNGHPLAFLHHLPGAHCAPTCAGGLPGRGTGPSARLTSRAVLLPRRNALALYGCVIISSGKDRSAISRSRKGRRERAAAGSLS